MSRTFATPRLSKNPARAFVFALLIAYALAATIAVTTHWAFQDADAYWNAAERLRAGEPLYVSSSDLSLPTLYRYAPWFAFAWLPLTLLPHGVVMALWGLVLSLAAIYLIRPVWSSPASIALSLLVWPDLLRVTSTGNVQPLMLAVVAYGLTSRWGPLLLGMAGSLKGYPLAFAAFWWREPARIGVAIGVALLLVLPIAAFDLSHYPGRADWWTPGTLSSVLVVSRLLQR